MTWNIPTSPICYWLTECFSYINFTDHIIDEIVVINEEGLISLTSLFQLSQSSHCIVLLIRKCYIHIPEWQWYLIMSIHRFGFLSIISRNFLTSNDISSASSNTPSKYCFESFHYLSLSLVLMPLNSLLQ